MIVLVYIMTYETLCDRFRLHHEILCSRFRLHMRHCVIGLGYNILSVSYLT